MYPKGYNPNDFISNPGQRFKPEYIGEEDENGIILPKYVVRSDPDFSQEIYRSVVVKIP